MGDHKYEGKPLRLTLSKKHVIELPPRIIRVRLSGLSFDTDKTFLLPDAMKGMRGLVDLYSDHEDMTLVVTGHSDRVGDAGYNLQLSDRRALSIAQFLQDDVAGWLENYGWQSVGKVWGTAEDQHMLGAVIDGATGAPFYTGSITGWLDGPTRDAVVRFQASRGLAQDGQPGPNTREALVTAYMQLDGTSLPEGAQVEQLGCGEHHNAIETADGVDEPQNRRAEVFMFDPGPVEPATPQECPGDGCPYETWRDKTVETYDFDEALGSIEVRCVDDLGQAVDGARVELMRVSETERESVADAAGVASFANLLPGSYVLRGAKQDHATASAQVEVSQGAAAAVLTMPFVDWDMMVLRVVASDDAA